MIMNVDDTLGMSLLEVYPHVRWSIGWLVGRSDIIFQRTLFMKKCPYGYIFVLIIS